MNKRVLFLMLAVLTIMSEVLAACAPATTAAPPQLPAHRCPAHRTARANYWYC